MFVLKTMKKFLLGIGHDVCCRLSFIVAIGWNKIKSIDCEYCEIDRWFEGLRTIRKKENVEGEALWSELTVIPWQTTNENTRSL
jgi:hypothetical protein